MVVGRAGLAPQVEDEIIGKSMEVLSCFNYLGSCFREYLGQREDMKIRVSVGLKTSGTMKMTFNFRSVVLGVSASCMEEW